MKKPPMLWSHLPEEVVAEAVWLCWRRVFVSPEVFAEVGVPVELVGQYEIPYKISNADTEVTEEVVGINRERVVADIACDLGLLCHSELGRQLFEHLGVKS